MLNWLIALILLALLPFVPTVCLTVPTPVVVIARVVVRVFLRHFLRTASDVTARFTRNTARTCPAVDEDRCRQSSMADVGTAGLRRQPGGLQSRSALTP